LKLLILKTVNKNIKNASTLDGKFYSSSKYFLKSLDLIFARSWHFVERNSIVSNNNDIYPFELKTGIYNEPLILVNKKNEINCLSNVCTHRGNILIKEKCNLKKITCNYHGRQFNTCGKFQFMPETNGMKKFPAKNDNLNVVEIKSWKQFLFANIDPVFKFNDLVKDMNNRVGWMPIEDFQFNKSLSKEYIVNANWALYCDNYLEGFHIPFIHNDLNNVLDFSNYQNEIFNYSNLQIGIAKKNDICFDIPNDSIDYGKKIAAYYFWLFPNMMFNFYPWGLSLNIVTPISFNKTKVIFKSYVWDEDKLNIGAGNDLDKVEKEDEEVVENVQKGVASRLYTRGRFSPSMEKGVHHFHILISEFLNNKKRV